MTRIAGSNLGAWQLAGAPTSGTSGSFAGVCEPGDLLSDVSNGVLFVNEGTRASPYWTPCGYDQAPLFGVHTDFRDQAGKAVADTAASAVVPGSGLRVFGQGVAETDSGLVVQTAAEGGSEARLTATNEDGHLIAIGMDAGVMQPDQHQLLVVDTELSHVSAITLRAMGLGFVGTAADALDPPVTGGTVTTTLVQDDAAGVFFDVGFTDADRLYAFHNKSNEAANQDATDGGRDTGVDIPAAGTYCRLRVEIDVAGNMLVFKDKVQVASIEDALDADEECSPVLWLESTSTATKSMDVRRFATWAYRL